MKETTVTTLFYCDQCGDSTKHPREVNWYFLNGSEESVLCRNCGEDLLKTFNKWLKNLGIQVEIEYLDSTLVVSDIIVGRIKVKSAFVNPERPGLKQVDLKSVYNA